MDEFDRAAAQEQRFRDRALAAQRTRVIEKPDIENGIHYCIDCGDVIPLARLVAAPNAVRCVLCQQKKEMSDG